MRNLPDTLEAALATSVTTLCRCWRLTRTDGQVLGFTDHDRDLVILGMTFEAASGLDASAVEETLGMAPGSGDVAGALRSARILPEEIALGLYDQAKLECWLVNWQAPALDLLLSSTTLGEIRQQDGRFIAETRNAFQRLDEERGRRFTVDCAAELGDAACGVDLSDPAFRYEGVLTAILNEATLVAPAFANAPTGLFTRGVLRITSGLNAGLRFGIREHRADGVLVLWSSLARLPDIGDGLVATAGCDKRLRTCRDRFANSLNFRGFPYLPQPEFVIAYANPGEGRHQGRPLVL